MRIEQLVDCNTTLGEGPLWDIDSQRIYWIDSFGDKVFRATEKGEEIESWNVPEHIGSMAVRRDGEGAIVALRTGFHWLDFSSGDIELIHDPEADKPGTRLNDGKVDRQGRFLAGSMDMKEEAPNGALYRLDKDLSCHEIETGIIVSNGPCWSPDGGVFYFTDTWSREFWAYDYDSDTGKISNRRTFCRLEGEGALDGATVDSDGFLWNAQVYGGEIVRYAPDGTVDRRIEMPVKKVTSVMFGGPNLDILFVTSMARPPLPHLPEDGPLGGSLFAIYDLGVTGIPEPRFDA